MNRTTYSAVGIQKSESGKLICSFIKKTTSWVLREITKKNPDEVAEFMMKWAKANPGKYARWVIKDGMKELGSNRQKKTLILIGG